jgi:hypothetical protein
MAMGSMRQRRIVGGMAAALLVAAISLLGAAGTAHASTGSGLPQAGERVERATMPLSGTDATGQARVRAIRTGIKNLDAYCQAVADLINDAYADAEWASRAGYPVDSIAYTQEAIEMEAGAESNGCSFTRT